MIFSEKFMHHEKKILISMIDDISLFFPEFVTIVERQINEIERN